MTKQGKHGFHYDNLENGCDRLKILVKGRGVYVCFEQEVQYYILQLLMREILYNVTSTAGWKTECIKNCFPLSSKNHHLVVQIVLPET